MASKKTDSTKSKAARKPAAKAKAAPKKAKPPKVAVKTGPRHPRARVVAAHGSKEALAKTVAAALARQGEDTDAVATQLKTASNKQLLHLLAVTETVKQKWGSREKLIEAIGTAQKKGKDQSYLAKLATYSLPKLVDLAKTAARAARA